MIGEEAIHNFRINSNIKSKYKALLSFNQELRILLLRHWIPIKNCTAREICLLLLIGIQCLTSAVAGTSYVLLLKFGNDFSCDGTSLVSSRTAQRCRGQ